MNRRENLISRIENLKGLVTHMIRIGEGDMARKVRNEIEGLERELEGMKRTNRFYS
jgi:archaellum component FlaC